MKESILATLVPVGLEPVVLSKEQAQQVMLGGQEQLLGHGIEVAFEVDGKPQWEHGEIINLKADEVRVKYYSDSTRHWHRRFRMDYYGQLAASTPGNRAFS